MRMMTIFTWMTLDAFVKNVKIILITIQKSIK